MKLTEITDVKRNRIKAWLDSMNITKYAIHADGTIDAEQDINFSTKRFQTLKTLPQQFGRITGNFYVRGIPISSLKGCPTFVSGTFNCDNLVKLDSLEHGPTEVGSYSMRDCIKIINLDHIAPVIHDTFFANRCRKLVSLKGLPKVLKGSMNLNQCYQLETLEHCPEELGGSLDLSSMLSLVSFNFLPKKMNGFLNLSGTPLPKNLLKPLFKVKGISSIIIDDNPLGTTKLKRKDLAKIINKYITTRDLIGCQDELIDAGFEEWAD